MNTEKKHNRICVNCENIVNLKAKQIRRGEKAVGCIQRMCM